MNRAILLHTALLAGVSLSAFAQAPPQDPNYQPQPPYPQQQPPYPQQQAPDGQHLSPQELTNLVAPIALYPDMLLSQVLAASTYPAEITQAQQWMQANPGLRGPQLVEAAKQQNWDPSVQALVAFPDVMNMLTRDIQWTTALGNAFLSQQAQLMDAIQWLRNAARNNGRLTDTPQQRVTYEQQNGQSAIVIQPANPQVIYAPVYNPEYVWGPPVYGAYPPLGYPGIGYGIYYGVATFLGAMFSGLLSFGGWGWGLSWLTHGLFLNNLFFSHFGFHGAGGYNAYGRGYAARSAWVHDPGHRLGVPYGNHYAGARYSGGSGSRGWSGFSSHNYSGNGGNYSNRSYNAGRSSYAGSGYQGGSRQMEAYRGLSSGASRGGNYSANNSYGSGYRGGGSGYSAPYQSASRSYSSGGYSRRESSGRGWSGSGSGRGNSSSHYSAPKSSSHFGGGGHSKGGGHSGGGGHSHGGSHKK
jgi:hypothetical protein